MLSLELRFDYPDASTARTVLEAISPDNGDYVESSIEDNILIFRMEAENAGTLRNTADDLLACIKTAEETIGIGRKRSHISDSGSSLFPSRPSTYVRANIMIIEAAARTSPSAVLSMGR